jgi:hypothetical protein
VIYYGPWAFVALRQGFPVDKQRDNKGNSQWAGPAWLLLSYKTRNKRGHTQGLHPNSRVNLPLDRVGTKRAAVMVNDSTTQLNNTANKQRDNSGRADSLNVFQFTERFSFGLERYSLNVFQ